MRVVIKEGQQNRYTINGYKYKNLQSSLPDLPPVPEGWSRATFKNLDDIPAVKEPKAPLESIEAEPSFESEAQTEDQSELIESLLKKADDFSTKYLQAQMELESLQVRMQENEEAIRKKAYEEGYNTAKSEQEAAHNQMQTMLFEQLKASIERITNESALFETALASIQEELVGAALDIAKEVIQKEIETNAQNIALHLARSLMHEIDKESKITLKVHPSHLQFFKESLGNSQRINIVEDIAVREGGVIVISNMGTIEADIMSRYEQVKRNVHTA